MKVITKATDKIPHSWDKVTFAQYLALNEAGNDYIKILSIFLDIDQETLKKAKVENFEAVIASLSFLKKEPIFYDQPLTLNGVKLPKDITWESTEQFEDMRLIISTLDDKQPIEQIKKFAEICAIYYQATVDGEYDSNKAKERLTEIYQMSCVEVISMGRFFFFKLVSSLTGTSVNSLKPITLARRKTLVILNWLKLSAFMERFKCYLTGIWSSRKPS